MEPQQFNPLPVPVDVWHRRSEVDAIVAGCIDWIPERFWTADIPMPRVDGHWGPHEIRLFPQVWDPKSPYMAWSTLSAHSSAGFRINNILDFTMDDTHFTPNAHVPHLGGLQKGIWISFKEEVDYLSSRVQDIQIQVSNDSHLQLPVEASRRLHYITQYLNLTDIYYRDCLEAVAALQRHISELQGFVLWSQDRFKVRSTRPFRLRGAIVRHGSEYMQLFNLDIPVWMEVDLSGVLQPRSDRHIPLTPLGRICDMRCWHQLLFIERTQDNLDDHGNLTHSKDLLFYPPHVDDPSKFERAARGYAPRTDKFSPDKRVTRELGRLTCIATGSTKRTSSNTDNKVLKKAKHNRDPEDSLIQKCQHHLEEAAKLTEWAPPPVKIWEVRVTANASMRKLCQIHASTDPLQLRFTTPPPSIFTRRMGMALGHDSDEERRCKLPEHKRAKIAPKNPQRCNTLLFIWVCIRRFWASKLDAQLLTPNVERLTTRDWKDLLHGNTFQNAWPKDSNGKLLAEFDIAHFWKHGDVFGCASVFEECSPVPVVDDRAFSPNDFKCDVLKSIVVWDAALMSAKYQFEEADNILMQATEASIMLERNAKRNTLFKDGHHISLEPHPSQSDDLPTRQDWTIRFTSLVADWPQYANWKATRPPAPDTDYICTLDFKLLDQFLERYIQIYYQGVYDALRTPPTPLLIRPDTTSLPEGFLSI